MADTQRHGVKRTASMRTLAEGVLLACASGFLTVGAIECGLRHYYPQYGGCEIGLPDPELHAVLKPNHVSVCVSEGHETVTPMRTDSRGFRRPPGELRELRGGYRIMMLGDSTTFGLGVNDDETVPVLLAGFLNGAADRAEDYDVVNAGVPGYGTAQEWLLYRRWGARLNPKLVILLFLVTNDIQDNLCEDNRRAPCFSLEGTTLVGRNLGSGPGAGSPMWSTDLHAWVLLRHHFKNFLASDSAVARFVVHAGLLPRQPDLPASLLGWYESRHVNIGWPLTRALLDALIDDLRRDGRQFVLVILPSRPQTNSRLGSAVEILYGERPEAAAWIADPERPQRLLTAWAQRRGVCVVDVLPPLRQAAASETVNLADGHFNARGNRVIASELYGALRTRCGLTLGNDRRSSGSWIPAGRAPRSPSGCCGSSG